LPSLGNLGPTLLAKSANAEEIEYVVDGCDTWKGYTDIMTCRVGEMQYVDCAVSTIEMKVPFALHSSRLFHSGAAAPKQQLLGQAVGLLQTSTERTHVLCYLTDIIALSVMYHVPGFAYLSERVVDARAFCLRLMLQCCDVTTEEWKTLLPSEDSAVVQVSLIDDVEIEEAACAARPRSRAVQSSSHHHATRSMGSATPSGKTKSDVSCYMLGCEQQDARERRIADITNLQVWEAKCFSRGVPYLGVDALHANALDTI